MTTQTTQTASGFYLYNDGLFLVSMHAVYVDAGGAQHDVAISDTFPIEKSNKELLAGKCPNLTPGTSVTLKAHVDLGRDNTAAESFRYDPEAPVQGYKITGTTLDNTLHYTGPMAQQATWSNWVGSVQHAAPIQGRYFFLPTTTAELQQVLAHRPPGSTVRASGQRHSQPPLVASDDRSSPPTATEILVDLSCYKDLGPNGDENMRLDMSNPDSPVLYVNAGVSESEVDAFLTENNLMFQTVTAGGFFSIGGMTAVDVHGATIQGPIFAETACSFDIMGADGATSTVDMNTPPVTLNGATWSPLQFARVSLGGLGIVTRIGLNVLPRPYKTTLQAGQTKSDVKGQAAFATELQKLVAHDRLEVFYDPYGERILALHWDVVQNPSPQTPNTTPSSMNACADAHDDLWGAPLISAAKLGEWTAQGVQTAESPEWATLLVPLAMAEIEGQMGKAIAAETELWLSGADYCAFMSYFIPLPDLGENGMNLVWDGLNAVAQVVTQQDNFHIAAPIEFRFIRSGNSAMAGTYSTSSTPITFLNLDLIGFVTQGTDPSNYPVKLLQAFATIERKWVEMGGLPHNGKMYGFYDPQNSDPQSYTLPFNQSFLNMIASRRGAPLQAYDRYRARRDPNGVFFNRYLKNLMGQS